MDVHMDGRTNGWIKRWMIVGWMDGQMDGWLNQWLEGQMVRWIDESTSGQIYGWSNGNSGEKKSGIACQVRQFC